MNKNNFFVKFAHFYRHNFIAARRRIAFIGEGITGMLGPLIELLLDIVILIFLIVKAFIPIVFLIPCFISKYMGNEDLKKLGVNQPAGYYSKKSVKKFESKLPKESV